MTDLHLPDSFTLSDFEWIVPDESVAERIMREALRPEGVCCGGCGSRNLTPLSTRAVLQCGDCRRQTSFRAGTVLRGTRKPLRDWLYVVCQLVRRDGGPSIRALAADLRYRYQTMFVMVHKVRAALSEGGAWQIIGSAHLGAALFPVAKHASGDPEALTPAVVGMAVAGDSEDPPPDRLRLHTPTAPDQTVDQLLADTRFHHVEPGACVACSTGAPAGDPWSRAAAPLRRYQRCIEVWLTNRFGGVSRRYLANYLAHYAYVVNRSGRVEDLRRFALRRLGREPPRTAADLALAEP